MDASQSAELAHIPVLRFGREYESLEVKVVRGYADGEPRARVSQATAGMLRRDLRQIGQHAAALRALSTERLFEICREAGEHFLHAELALSEGGEGGRSTQSPDEYVATLSATSGLPHVLCRANMEKVAHVLLHMPDILRGLTRGLDPAVLDRGVGQDHGLPVSYARAAESLGVVLPSNSPGVNGLWIPALALGTPVLLKPGREEPWTPLRVLRALIAAGLPAEAVGFYPTSHEGAHEILQSTDRGLLFGDDATTGPWADNPAVEIHGTGRSKVLLGPDEAPNWERYLDVMVSSIAANGGRSCVNASAIYTPSHGDEIAAALAQRLAQLVPLEPQDPQAGLSAFANPRMAQAIDAAIETGLRAGGEDVTARFRSGPRAQNVHGGDYLLPTLVRCANTAHPLANVEYLFPFASVVEVDADKLVAEAGTSLVVSAITRDPLLQQQLVSAPEIGRLNLGPSPTHQVSWDQPHEGNLFELLFTRRAIEQVEGW